MAHVRLSAAALVLVRLCASADGAEFTTLLSENFSGASANYTLPGASNPFRFYAGPRYWALSNTPGLTPNAGVSANDGAYLAIQNINDGGFAFTSASPAQIDFSVPAAGYKTLTLSIALAGMPAAEAENFIRAKADSDGNGTYETTIFNFQGSSNSAYTDAVLGALTGAFKTFPDISLPLPSAADGRLRLRIEAFNDTESFNEASGIDNIVIKGSTTFSSSGPLTRGPYLQMAAPTQMTVRWRGGVSVPGRVCYGTHVNNLNQIKDEAVTPGVPADHSVTLTGLMPDTRYYYSVGSEYDTLASGAEYTFKTPPAAGTAMPTRIWVLGDAGTGTTSQTAVRDAFYTWTGTRTPELVLQLGDNAYNSGTDSEFTAGMFNIYPAMLRKTPFWSCLGNHETYVGAPYPYFSIYTLPTAGECGGVASGTESYYAFDYGNIHFICLDSMMSNRSSTGPMATWLKADLAGVTAPWIICFFHHPPYTKGSHDSDTEAELKEMRTNFLPILDEGGVDLVLCGHSHSYERSFLLDGHYGVSTTLTSAMKKDAGNGRPSGTGAYIKPLTGPRDHLGAVYAVAGSAGKISGGGLNHPAHFISLNNLGSLVLDIDGTRLDATFLRENGTTPDTFAIIKKGAADRDKDGIADQYELDHGLDRQNGSDANLDQDSDGVSNLKEWILGTSASAPDNYSVVMDYATGNAAAVRFQSILSRNYRVMYSEDLSNWLPASNTIQGTGEILTWSDDGSATGSSPLGRRARFYRVQVEVAQE